MKETIFIKYGDLKRIYCEIVDFTEIEYCELEKQSSNTSINLDLGIDGDDAVEFLEKFSARFSVNFDSLEFSKYFLQEGRINSFGAYLNKYMETNENFEELTIGDLVVSVINNRFCKRKDFTFVFIK